MNDELIRVFDKNHPEGSYITYVSNLPKGLKYEVIEQQKEKVVVKSTQKRGRKPKSENK